MWGPKNKFVTDYPVEYAHSFSVCHINIRSLRTWMLLNVILICPINNWHHRNLAELTRTTRMPASEDAPPPHDYPFILDPKSKRRGQSYTFKEFAKTLNFWILKKKLRHTSWSCPIRCVNIKWIRQVLWKTQSGHDSVHRRTDGRTASLIGGV